MKITEEFEYSRAEFNVVPLVNIVFLLLIFFMLVGHIAPTDKLQVEPPESSSGEIDDSQPILLLMTADGQIAVGDEVVSEDELVSHIQNRLEKNAELSFRVKADAHMEADRLIKVLEKLQFAGVKTLSLLTERTR